MASEDSDQVLSGCPSVHRFRDLCDLHEPADTEVSTSREDAHAARELLEVPLLRGPKRMSLEKRNDRLHEVFPPVHDELTQMLAMVVVASADVDATNAKEASQPLQRRATAHALRHHEPMRDLVPGLVASALRSALLPHEADGEASLSVHKAGDPAKLNQPFLLVSCTRHIVTVPPAWDGARSAGYSGFPAYSQMHTAWSPMRGAAFYLRTVPDCYYSSNCSSGPLISDGLSWSPMRADYLIPRPLQVTGSAYSL